MRKGDLFTKYLEPCKFEAALALHKIRKPRLPALAKKGKVVDFRLGTQQLSPEPRL